MQRKDEARLRRLAQQLPAGCVSWAVGDVATEAGRARVLEAARAAVPAPSVLVLAHAQAAFGLFEDQAPEEMAHLMQTNLVAPMLTGSRAAPDGATGLISAPLWKLLVAAGLAAAVAVFVARGLR